MEKRMHAEPCRIGTGPQNDWYLFSHRDKKYPTGTRTNRATAAGFWKATGRDKAIYSAAGSGRIGMRKTLVFYKGRAPHGHKSDWIMHEYRLHHAVPVNPTAGDATYYSSDSFPVRALLVQSLSASLRTVQYYCSTSQLHARRPADRDGERSLVVHACDQCTYCTHTFCVCRRGTYATVDDKV